jgi:nucleoside-diphosphate-sugar epimerase
MIFGSRRFNFVSVRNVVSALLHVAGAPLGTNGDVFIVADDDDPDNDYRSVETLIRTGLGEPAASIGRVLPLPLLSLLFRPFPDRAAPDQVYSAAKLRRLAYRKATTLRDTIGEIVAFELDRAGRIH